MAHDSKIPEGPVPVEEAPLDQAYLAIPDRDNEAIIDARKTYVATVVGSVLFVLAVFLFIL